jgi:cytochrome P450
VRLRVASGLRALASDPLGTIEEAAQAARAHGIVELAGGRQPVFLVGDMDVAREVLITRAAAFVKQNIIDSAGGAMDARDPGDDPHAHAAGRRVLAPVFAAGTEHAHELGVRRAVAAWVDALPAGRVDLAPGLHALTASLVGELALGKTPDDPNALAQAASDLFAGYALVSSPTQRLAGLVHVGRLKGSLAGLRTLSGFYDRVWLDAATAVPTAPSLLRAAGEEKESARQRVVNLLLAGIDTTATALSWSLLLLSEHDAAQERLRTEVVSGEHAKLSFSRAVVSEALRLYPPSWYLGRRALTAQVFAGVSIEAGSVVLVAPYVLHRDPATFPEPETFDPARWLEGRADTGAFIPFGLGSRRCLGERLAWMEAVVGVELVARRFRLLPAGPLPAVVPTGVLAPHGGAFVHLEPLG